MSASDTSTDEWYLEDNNPRWPYEKYVRTYFGKPLRYEFVRQRHDLTLYQLRDTYIARSDSWARFLPVLSRIEEMGIRRLFEFLDAISTREQAERLMEQTGITRAEMEDLLDFIKRRWFIPQLVQLRQLVDTSDEALFAHFQTLKQHKVANSYALLEKGRTKAGREALAVQTGVPEDVILDFVRRADITRMPWVGGRIVKQLWAIGYTSLEQVRNADPEDYLARIDEYYRHHGKGKPFDLTPKNARGLIEAARKLPTIVEE